MRRAGALLLALASCSHRVAVDAVEPPPRGIVFVARTVRTLDPERPLAQAVAVLDRRLVAVGTRAQAIDAVRRAGVEPVVEVLDGVLVPGLVDAHGHLESFGRTLVSVNLFKAGSEAEVVARVKAAGPDSYEGEWLLGRGWDQNDWPGQRFPERAALDAAFPSTPVFLTRVDGHAGWANAEALRRAGITKGTVDPAGGRVLRDGAGEPTGVLIDNAMNLVTAKVPAPTPAQRKARLKRALEACAAFGLTGLHDAGTDPQTFAVLQEWDGFGQLPLRVYAMADAQGEGLEGWLGRGPFKGRLLTLRAVKLLADGALGSRGAALEAPYADEPSQKGLLLLSPEELSRRAQAAAARGFQVAVHAIGDRANTLVLDVLEKLEAAHPGARHRVEHAQVLAASDVERFAKANLVVSFQPTHATSDMPWAQARLGPERARLAYAWRTVLSTGARVAFGSDFPIESANPLLGLYAARTRQDAQGQPAEGWFPKQRVTGEEALAGFTTGAAYAEFAEATRGMLKEGYDADFVVLSVDPVDDPPEALLTAKVLLTVSDGRDVYRRAP